MAARRDRVLIIPCSGIGKAFGTIGREAAYMVTDDLRKDCTDTICLSLLVMGDEEARKRVRDKAVITVDGCPTACARKNVETAGGTVGAALRVVDTYRQHHEFKPVAIAELDEAGQELARFLADEITAVADKMMEGDHAGTSEA
ncbi:MAG: putative zinc-binding protein [Chloroflexi bacterium]|nr:putative zinc-binding protein [Chloroflexota bacterium]